MGNSSVDDSIAGDLEALAQRIGKAERVVAVTGAGISAPSGVPTFRGDDGIWERFEEGQFTYGRFQRDPAGFWRDRLELHRAMYDDGGEPYEPNPAHLALARLGATGHLEAVVTQNTDGLHTRAIERVREEDTGLPADGPELIELHGNAHRVACTDCGTRVAAEPVFDRVADGEVPPRCECGGRYRPDVVLFGQRLDDDLLQRARHLARESDVLLAIGSSLVVEPAASLPRIAARSGATVAVVTLESTPVDDLAVTFRQDVVDVLPALEALIHE